MKSWIAVIVGSMFLIAGCSNPATDSGTVAVEESTTGETTAPDQGEPAVELTSHEKYCGSCGHVAGAEACCKAGADNCEKCGLNEGAPLCCKLEGDFSEKKLCGGCGEVAGGEKCCSDEAEKCEKCNLQKGSPLCCKLEKK